jgi:hypothetical protein
MKHYLLTIAEAYLGAKKSRLYVQCKTGPFNLYKKTISMKPENMHHEIVAVYNRSTQPVPYEMWKQNRLYDFGVYIRNPVDCHIRDYVSIFPIPLIFLFQPILGIAVNSEVQIDSSGIKLARDSTRLSMYPSKDINANVEFCSGQMCIRFTYRKVQIDLCMFGMKHVGELQVTKKIVHMLLVH